MEKCQFCNAETKLKEVIDVAGEPEDKDLMLCESCIRDNQFEAEHELKSIREDHPYFPTSHGKHHGEEYE